MSDDVNRIILPTPTEQQKKFLELTDPEQLYGGAKSGGKTFIGCLKAVLLSTMIPGNRGMICRLNWPQLRDSTLESFTKQVCPAELRTWRASDKIHIMKTIDPRHNSEIMWRALGDPDDFEKAKGTEIGWLWIDEPTEVPLDTYKMLRAQLRWKLPGGKCPPYMTFLTSNPEPGWVKERFITNMVKGGVFIPSLPRDNPHLPPNYIQDLVDAYGDNSDWFLKYMEGSWEIGEGTVFKELNSQVHVLEEIDWRGMRMVGGIDHASTGVTCYMQCGIDADENVYVLEEYYRKDRLISQHAAAIRELMTRYGGNDYTIIDPSTVAKTLQGPEELYSVLDEYRRNGVIARAARRANLEVGINLLNEYLHPSPKRRHPRTQERPSPRIFVQKSKCPNFWREMSELRSQLTPTGRIEYLGSDHAIDPVRYIAMSRPGAAELAQEHSDYMLQPNDPLSSIALHSFAKWDKGFAKVQDDNAWFPRPN